MAEENKTEQSVEMISFGIIANAGDARSFAFQALEAAKHGNFDEADELMKKSDEAATLAHKAQTDLLFNEVNGNTLRAQSPIHQRTVRPNFRGRQDRNRRG